MYDAVLKNIGIANRKYSNGVGFDEVSKENGKINAFKDKEYYLATIHRAENTDNPEKLIEILKAFKELDKPVLLPLHPRTKKIIESLNIELNNITIIRPVGYLLMLYLTSNSYMVITDSGGLQKEAYFLKVPCTTLRDQTEWIETLENSWNVLSQIEVDEIKRNVQRDLTILKQSQSQLFGDGKAVYKIYDAIINGGKISE